MNINFFRMLLMTFLAVVGLAACSDDDEPKDSVKEIRMLVSAETGVTYAWGDDMKENPIECLLVKTEGDSEEWQYLGFEQIKGFTYERGHEYYLSVKRTILANPPADAFDRRYELIRVLQDRLVADPEIPIDKEIKTEADIEYYDLCPFEKYGVASTIVVDDEGKINGKVEYDNVSPLPSYDKARIWLVNILDHKDPNWVKFHSVPYQATYSYVISPFTDKIRLVRNESSGPMFKNVVPEDEFTRIRSMKYRTSLGYIRPFCESRSPNLVVFGYGIELGQIKSYNSCFHCISLFKISRYHLIHNEVKRDTFGILIIIPGLLFPSISV